MQCAKCSGTLKNFEVAHIEIDQCDQCGGYWFDRKELKQLLALGLGERVEASQDGEYISHRHDHAPGRCPHCRVGLERVDSIVVEGIGYDECPECQGVWLDKGELGEMSEQPDAASIIGFFTSF